MALTTYKLNSTDANSTALLHRTKTILTSYLQRLSASVKVSQELYNAGSGLPYYEFTLSNKLPLDVIATLNNQVIPKEGVDFNEIDSEYIDYSTLTKLESTGLSVKQIAKKLLS